MDESVKKIFKTQFDRLPKELREALTSTELRKKLFAMTQKYHLHIDKAGILENEVVLVLMGMESPSLFVGNIERELQLSPENANALAKDVNDEIFHPIHEHLMGFLAKQEEEFEKESEEAKAAALLEATPSDEHVDPYREAPDGTTALRAPKESAAPRSVIMPSGMRPAAATIPEPVPAIVEKKVETPVELPRNIVGDKLGASISLRSILGGNAPGTATAAAAATPPIPPAGNVIPADTPATSNVAGEAKPPIAPAAPAKDASLDPYRETFS